MKLKLKNPVILTLSLLALWLTLPLRAEEALSLYIDGTKTEVHLIARQGVIYAPAYAVAEALKIRVEWQPQFNLVKLNGDYVPIKPEFSGEQVLYLPVEAMAKASGAALVFDGTRHLVSLITAGAVIEPVPTPTPTVLPTPKPTLSPPAEGSPFIPRTVKSSPFAVTVSNLEALDLIKGYYKPASGNKYVIVYISQTNISNEIQIYTGTFSLTDVNNKVYEYIEGLSNFWLVILKPGGTNFGYLVYELPADAQPASLVLHALNQKPLSVNLH